jgi:hypothetical protein
MKLLAFGLIPAFLLFAGATANAQGKLRLTPVRGTSKVVLHYGTRSATVDLEKELGGDNGSLPGEPPHRFTVLFTAQKDDDVYLVAKVCSGSPISDPNAPCGGDRPCALLWIKTDLTLKNMSLHSEIYESCSYNFYDSKVTLSRTGVKISYGAAKKKQLVYDNTHREQGLVIADVAT